MVFTKLTYSIVQLIRQHQSGAEPERTSGAQSGNKIIELESIRGVAALLVVLFHIPGWHPSFYYIGFIRNSNLMVDLFFVLSGFVIYKAYSVKIQNKMDLFRIQFLRFGRLYPVHLLLLLLFQGVEFAKYYAELVLDIQSSHTTP
jgi:peptidoglycan/LPS O-acetylase OafA/YrhL